jgi:RNA polymerase sigma-70 factor (ECF subfamily)
MKKINLKAYYAHITEDTSIDIPDKVFDIFEEYRKAEQAYQSRIRYHKAYYSLDRDDGIEHSALFLFNVNLGCVIYTISNAMINFS